jgi:1-aminocyclopropane-1-carboxylate deaminase
MPELKNITIDQWQHPGFRKKKLVVEVLRLDKIHPEISGNKWFKLKYYLEKAARENRRTLISYGGAYSNHLLALAAAARLYGFFSAAMIRGEEPAKLSPTLISAREYGMELNFLARSEYDRQKKTQAEMPDTLVIPEGGAGPEGILGAEEILTAAGPLDHYTHICCATGTGTTLAGIINSTRPDIFKIGISVLKGTKNLEPLNLYWIKDTEERKNIRIIHEDHFGGYAKYTDSLIGFMNEVYRESGIPTDFVYTAKLFYSIVRMTAENAFVAGSRMLVLHTGGLQGNRSLAPGQLEF